MTKQQRQATEIKGHALRVMSEQHERPVAICECGLEMMTTARNAKYELRRQHEIHLTSRRFKELGFVVDDNNQYIAEGEGADGIKMGNVVVTNKEGRLPKLYNESVWVYFTDGDGQELLSFRFPTLLQFFQHAEAQ